MDLKKRAATSAIEGAPALPDASAAANALLGVNSQPVVDTGICFRAGDKALVTCHKKLPAS